MQPKCGYKVVTPVQLANVIWAYRAGKVRFAAVKVFFAALEMVAIREAAKRANKSRRQRMAMPLVRYSTDEMVRLTGLARRVVIRERGRLERAGVFRFDMQSIEFCEGGIAGSEELCCAFACKRSPARPIPIPRKLILFLAKANKPALLLTSIGYVVRGLSLDRQTAVMKNKGTLKLSWVSDALGVSERAARYARRTLITLGLISKDIGSRQWKLNRDGAYFEFNLSWRVEAGGTKNAPATPKKRTKIAPPYKTDLTSFGSKDQKTAADGLTQSGVCTGPMGRSQERPSIHNIHATDLQCFFRVEELYFQACRCELVKPSESAALDFLAAAVRAREAKGDAPRVFMGIVRRSLWQYITQQQEDRARSALVRFRADDPNRFRLPRNTFRVPSQQAVELTKRASATMDDSVRGQSKSTAVTANAVTRKQIGIHETSGGFHACD